MSFIIAHWGWSIQKAIWMITPLAARSLLLLLLSNHLSNVILFLIEIVSETQLRKYGKFLEDYASQLSAIEKALDDTVGESWDLTLDPISLQVY